MATQQPPTPHKLRIHPAIGLLILIAAILLDGAQIIALFVLAIPNVDFFNLAVTVALLVTSPVQGVMSAIATAKEVTGGIATAIGTSWYIGILGLIGLGLWFTLLDAFKGKSVGKR